MRSLIFAVVAIALAQPARAVGVPQNPTQTFEISGTSLTVRGLNITSSAGATSVVISTAPLWREVCVQNIGGVGLFCGDSSNVTSTLTSDSVGVNIATAAATPPPVCFPLVPGQDFFCAAALQSAGTSRAVIRRRR